MQQLIRVAFRDLGLGAIFLTLTLFGRAAADATSWPLGWQTPLLVLGGLGVSLILFGLIRFLLAIARLQNIPSD